MDKFLVSSSKSLELSKIEIGGKFYNLNLNFMLVLVTTMCRALLLPQSIGMSSGNVVGFHVAPIFIFIFINFLLFIIIIDYKFTGKKNIYI